MTSILSICIASYANDLSDLLRELKTCEDHGLSEGWALEICISDQGPRVHALQEYWEKEFGVRYFQYTEKLGRAANRNHLASQAKGTHLLFLDADALPTVPAFLFRYTEALRTCKVVVGGTAYLPGHLSERLRYKIGKVKEEVLPEVRNKNPWGAFSAFNFAIEAELLKHITFDESLVEYGHEDTLFGLELRHRCIEVCHVFNPAYHLGIDEDVAFMEKTRRGVDNLAALIELGKIDEEVTLYKAYLNAQKTGIIGLLKWNVSWLEPWLFNRLALGKGPLFLFDLYKLLRLSKGITSTPRKNF